MRRAASPRASKASPAKYIASCMVQPMPSAFMRASDASEALFRCAIDQRSAVIGVSRLTRSYRSSSCPTDRSCRQWMVTDSPARAAQRAIS